MVRRVRKPASFHTDRYIPDSLYRSKRAVFFFPFRMYPAYNGAGKKGCHAQTHQYTRRRPPAALAGGGAAPMRLRGRRLSGAGAGKHLFQPPADRKKRAGAGASHARADKGRLDTRRPAAAPAHSGPGIASARNIRIRRAVHLRRRGPCAVPRPALRLYALPGACRRKRRPDGGGRDPACHGTPAHHAFREPLSCDRLRKNRKGAQSASAQSVRRGHSQRPPPGGLRARRGARTAKRPHRRLFSRSAAVRLRVQYRPRPRPSGGTYRRAASGLPDRRSGLRAGRSRARPDAAGASRLSFRAGSPRRPRQSF